MSGDTDSWRRLLGIYCTFLIYRLNNGTKMYLLTHNCTLHIHKSYHSINTSRINPRYEICYFSDKIFILSLILSLEMITPGLDLSTDARGTEYLNSVPVGTAFQKVRSILKDLSRWSL